MDQNPPPINQKLGDELLQLIARQASRVPLPVLCTMAILAWLASDKTSPWVWGSWLGLATCLLLIRWQVLSKLPELHHLSINYRLNMASVLAGLNGLVHGASVIFFPDFSELERALQLLMLSTLCAGTVATTAGYRTVFISYTLPTLLPVCLMWIANSTGGSHLIVYSVVALTFVYGYVLLTLGDDAFRMFKESFEIRNQQMTLNRKLKNALAEAEAANRSKTRFLASASHDLRQPIHTLSLFGAALDMQPLNERSREITQHMNTALQALASELDSLLDISKLDANVVTVEPVPVNLGVLLQRLSSEAIPSTADKDLELKFNCSKEIWVETDEVLLERILRNLITNAVNYTTSGHISIKADYVEQQAVVEIEDTGCGISKEEQQHIFEEFYQVSNPERDRARGLGLGLAIVYRLVKLLDIKLELKSDVGFGSCFNLSIPKANLAPQLKPKAIEPAHSWDSLTVLVVDDVAAVGLGMKTLLESLGCTVLVTDSTETAIAAAQETTPNIVLADFRLRNNDTGIKTINTLRSFLPDLPAILISGDTAPTRLQEAKAAELELLHKPVMVEALKQSIANACDLNEDVDHDSKQDPPKRSIL